MARQAAHAIPAEEFEDMTAEMELLFGPAYDGYEIWLEKQRATKRVTNKHVGTIPAMFLRQHRQKEKVNGPVEDASDVIDAAIWNVNKSNEYDANFLELAASHKNERQERLVQGGYIGSTWSWANIAEGP